MDDDLVAILSEAKHLPKDAMKRALAAPDIIAEPTLRVLATAADDPDAVSDADADLLFWGLHVLAACRDTRVFQPLLRLLRQDLDTLDGLLGDATTETLRRVLASAFDGDAEALQRLILDSTLDDFVRNEAFAALAFLTRQGRIEPAFAHALLVRFDDARVAVEESPGWVGWEEAIAYLGFTDLAPRAEAARRDGRLTEEFSDAAWFRKALRQASAEPPDLSAFDPPLYGYLDDPLAALAWTDESAGKPVKNPMKSVGRNDPCPCGSGKKYKKCCLDADAAVPAQVKSPLPGLH